MSIKLNYLRFTLCLMNESESIENKLIEMIDIFRSEFDKLTPPEKLHEQMINSLKIPCQIFLIMSLETQTHFMIITRFDNMSDKIIKCVTLNNNTLLDQLDEIEKNPMWINVTENLTHHDITLPSQFGNSVRSSLLSYGKLVRDVINFGKISQNSMVTGMHLINEKISVWNIVGDLNKIDFSTEAKKIINEYKQYYQQSEKEKLNVKPIQLTESIPNMTAGLGTYFYPPVLIGELNPSFKEQMEGKEYELMKEIILRHTFENFNLIVTRGGLIGLDISDQDMAEKVLNIIMGTALLFGINLHAVKLSEIARINIDKSSQKITGSSYSRSTLRMMMFSMVPQHDFPEFVLRQQIKVDDLTHIIEKTKELWNNTELLNSIKLLSTSFTHLENLEYSQSFIISWTIIEMFIHNLWNKKLQSSGVTKRIREDLDRWDLYKVLEVLHLDKIVLDDEYYDMKNLNSLRNDLIHFGQQVTPKQSQHCYQLAHHFVKDESKISKTLITKKILSL